MVTLVNRAKVSTATTGTGTITLGAAESGYQSFADAGVVDTNVVRYVIEDGDAWEIGTGTYTATGTTLTRTVTESSNADAAISLTGSAVVYVSAAGADIVQPSDLATVATTGAYTDLSGLPTLYTDAAVDTHLNTGTATTGEVLSWTGADYDWITSGGATDINGLSDGYSDGNSMSLGTSTLNASSTARTTVLGFNAGFGISSSGSGVYIGAYSSASADGVGSLVAIGDSATAGNLSVSIGASAGASMGTLSSSSVFVGERAGQRNNAAHSIGIGSQALYGPTAKTTGINNIGIGSQTGFDVTTGANNFFGGYRAGYELTTGSNNVAIGNSALDRATTGGRNIAIGQDAMGLGVATAASGDNIAIGYQAGYNVTSGTDNIFIGETAGDATTTGTNQIVIGQGSDASSATVSNEITLGNSSIATLRCQVTTITSLSDARDKTDIQPLNAGLDFVNALEPVSFTWNMRDGGKVGEADTGFIAQDLKRVQEETGISIPHLVFDANPEKLEAGYGKLLPVLVQAIKDLSAKVDELEAKLEAKP